MIMQQMNLTLVALALAAVVQPASAELKVTNIHAIHRSGQTFVTWE